MRSILFLLLAAPLLLPAQNAPDFAALLLPPALTQDANAVIRRQEITFTVRAAGEATLRERRVVTLLNDRSPLDLLVLHYDSHKKIGKIKGRVFDALGNLVRDIEKREIKDVSAISDFSIYEDSRVKYVDVDFSDFPFTVEFEYEIEYDDLLSYPDFGLDEFFTSIESAGLKIDLPEKMKLSYKNVNISTLPEEKLAGGRRIYRWQATNIPAVKWEPYAPTPGELLPKVLIAPHQFEVENYVGSQADWTSFGLFMNQLSKGRDELSPAMKFRVKELTAGAADDREKIDRLYRYLQENMRYVSVQLGIGGWQPFDARYVEQNKYGDCKALSNFMKAMLREAGIPAQLALVCAGERMRFEAAEDIVQPGAFNHVILHVPAPNYWLECTSNDNPPNYLGTFTANRNVVLLTDSGGKLARTPDLPPVANLETGEIQIALAADGSATVEVKSKLAGERHEWYRGAVKQLSQAELQKEFQEKSALRSFVLQSLTVEPQPDLPEATVTFKAQLATYASKAGKRLFVPMNAVQPFTEVPPANEKRLHPIVRRDGYVEEAQLRFLLPPGYRVESAPPSNLTLESDFGSYTIMVETAEGQLSVKRRLEIKPVRLPAGHYEAWRNFYKEVAKVDGTKIVLVAN